MDILFLLTIGLLVKSLHLIHTQNIDDPKLILDHLVQDFRF